MPVDESDMKTIGCVMLGRIRRPNAGVAAAVRELIRLICLTSLGPHLERLSRFIQYWRSPIWLRKHPSLAETCPLSVNENCQTGAVCKTFWMVTTSTSPEQP